MKRKLEYHIQKEESIRDFLREKGFSRHILIQLKKAERSILLEGEEKNLNACMKRGQTLTVHYTEDVSSEHIAPVYVPLDIMYEDEDLIVLNKPDNMPVHPSQGNHENTLANGLAYYYREKGQAFVFRCINRLDRDTTGLLVVAKHGISGCILSAQMKERKIHREYYAVVEGKTPPLGRINAPIMRAEGSTIERKVDFAKGEEAVTNYQTAAYMNGYSLLRIRLETGRTHQIRVHMKYIGHPLPGDFLYNPDYHQIKRQPLHSAYLSFFHPITGKYMEFTAALPDDIICIFTSQKDFFVL